MNLENRLNEVIDKKVRPILKLHNGDMEIISLVDKVLRIKMIGACSGCPSAQVTNEEIIKKEVLKQLGDEIENVVLVNQMSEDLLEFAKKILNKN